MACRRLQADPDSGAGVIHRDPNADPDVCCGPPPYCPECGRQFHMLRAF